MLRGDKYIDNSVGGEQCHRKRIDFEVSIPAELRRRIYRALAEAGLGRDILMHAIRGQIDECAYYQCIPQG